MVDNENQSEEKKSKIPGFRSGKLWKKIIAIGGYFFIGLFVLAMILPSDNGIDSDNQKTTTPSVSPMEISQAAYAAGMEQYNNNELDNAIESFGKVVPDDSNYQDAQAKLTELKNKHTSTYLASAKANLQNNEFDLALADTNKTLKHAPDNQEAIALMADIPAQKAAYEERKKQQVIEDFKNSCQVMSYKVLNKNPDNLVGQRIKLNGEIMQIQEDSGKTFMLLSVTNMGYGYWDDNVAVFYDGTADIYEDDIITVWGVIDGKFAYKSQAGWDITVPRVNAEYVEG